MTNASYYVTYYERLRKVMHQTEKVALTVYYDHLYMPNIGLFVRHGRNLHYFGHIITNYKPITLFGC